METTAHPDLVTVSGSAWVPDPRQHERAARLPYRVLVAVTGCAVAAAAVYAPEVDAIRHARHPATLAFPSLPALIVLPALVPIALEVLLSAFRWLGAGRNLAFLSGMKVDLEECVADDLDSLSKSVLARLTEMGFDGAVDRPGDAFEVTFQGRWREHLPGFRGTPVRGRIQITSVDPGARVAGSLSIGGFILRDTGERAFARRLLAYLIGSDPVLVLPRAPLAAMGVTVGFALAAAILVLVAELRGSYPALLVASATALYGVGASVLAAGEALVRWRRVFGVPETALAALVNGWVALVTHAPDLVTPWLVHNLR